MSVDMPVAQKWDESVVALGTKNDIEMAILRRRKKTLGKIIIKPDSPDLIDDVKIEPLHTNPDDRGFFTGLARLGEGPATPMLAEGHRPRKISLTRTYPGTSQEIHSRLMQTDLWAPVSGMLQVFLCDLRRRSGTFELSKAIYAGKFHPWEILSPPGVGHGYKTLEGVPVELLGFTDHHSPADEFPVEDNGPAIARDLGTQHN